MMHYGKVAREIVEESQMLASQIMTDTLTAENYDHVYDLFSMRIGQFNGCIVCAIREAAEGGMPHLLIVRLIGRYSRDTHAKMGIEL